MDETTPEPVRLLMVCGSLQSARPTAPAALDVAAGVATDGGAAVETFDRLAELPAFDPDRSDEPDEVVAATGGPRSTAPTPCSSPRPSTRAVSRARSRTRSTGWWPPSRLYRTPVAVISAGTTGGPHALVELAQTLTWQGAYVVGAPGIAAPRTKSDEQGRFTDAATLAAIRALTEELLGAASGPGAEVAATAKQVVGRVGDRPRARAAAGVTLSLAG